MLMLLLLLLLMLGGCVDVAMMLLLALGVRGSAGVECWGGMLLLALDVG